MLPLCNSNCQVRLACVDTPSLAIECSRKVTVLANETLQDAMRHPLYDAIIAPGGLANAKALAKVGCVDILLRLHAL